ncbi:MAG: hypothetical protein KGR48_16500 [Alphaproteobacteria bacterium]|nr:hypothetical protein [Alphaproteobacteria bacterium]MBU6472026.1 hypothetical protein [Alphaproteobacteria bacterium]MDE2013596.1 hypothetical protein [Alphaproteobacteria bacterium]MDE2074237.1 hypothetical protein [Alphaproteobacteria bacterium]MDE2352976.1 hypothetical protein [Alphaproteobacteria bacterium]
MRDNSERETSPALGGLVVAIAILLAFIYALGDGNAFASLIANLIGRAGDML